MTEFNPSTLLSFSAAGYYAGVWALSLPFVFLAGLLFYSLTVAKKWKEYDGMSVAGFFKARYGSDFATIIAVMLYLAMAGFSATYIKSLTLIFSPILPSLNHWQLGLIIVAAILLLSLRGGLISIIKLDQISFIFILVFIPYLYFKSQQLASITSISIIEGQQFLAPKFVLSLVLLTMFSYILAPWYGQKIISANSPKTAAVAVAIAAIIISLLYSCGVLAVYSLKKHGVLLVNPDTGFPYLLDHILPIRLKGVSYVLLFAIGATTIAGVWSAMVTLLIGDKYVRTTNSLTKNYTRVLFTAAFCYLIANTLIDNILNKMILANIPIVAASFALLAGFYWPKATKLAAYVSFIIGILWGLSCYLHFGDKGNYTWYWAAIGIPLIFVSGVVTTLIGTKAQEN